jgi:UDP-glucose 4-epimerase
MEILISGGAGFIGSTIASASIDAGHIPVIIDDMSTGAEAFVKDRIFYRGDVSDPEIMNKVFHEHPQIAAAVHCAASIVVPDSVADPLGYYRNNVSKTVEFVGHLNRLGCQRILFSSSASIYAVGEDFTVDESSSLDPQSPYARTKAMVEEILADAAQAGLVSCLSLRYFNPVGADPKRRTGQQRTRPSHALGKLLEAHNEHVPFTITGVDWPTRDGSAIRDYIHVWDLALAHVRALERFDSIAEVEDGYAVINLGTGRGTTVRELVHIFESATDVELEISEGPPRPGDVVGSYTRVDKAESLLAWTAQLSIADAVQDALAWSAIRDAVLRSA